MKLIIAGSRTLEPSVGFLQSTICNFNLNVTEIVSGCARGVDTSGASLTNVKLPITLLDHKLKGKLEEFPADWNKYGKSAGYKRNLQMGEYADALICFWDGKSKGSRLMINIAKKLNLPTRIIYYGGINEKESNEKVDS